MSWLIFGCASRYAEMYRRNVPRFVRLRPLSGEPSVTLDRDGVGGRNTHAAVLAAQLIHGTEWIFAALATDGLDGSSGLSGAIVDGTTLDRGGSPLGALESFDTGRYLQQAGDALAFGPTGTNVADVWMVWKP